MSISLSNGVNYHAGEYLLIEDGRILGFERASHLYSDLEVVDFSSDFCVPGLVDTAFLAPVGVNEDGTRPAGYGTGVWHAKQLSQKWLDSGVTSAASMGGIDRLDLDLGKSIAEGRLIGPRIYPALSPLVPAGMSNFGALYGVREVSGVDEARRAVRELIKQGAERIVLYADVPLEFHADPHETSRHRLVFSVDELVEMVTQARQAGCYLHAQAISAAAIDNAFRLASVRLAVHSA
ncbi:MAG: hypothetical protein IPK19_10445 [Chloroflexi bacterium]|nr:hypothetical protein [Chloroflexota bacterium]